MHGPDINPTYSYLKYDDGNHMTVNEGQSIILQAQGKKERDGGGNIRLKKKVIELHYFKEWKVGTSLCASMLEDPNLKFFRVEQA